MVPMVPVADPLVPVVADVQSIQTTVAALADVACRVVAAIVTPAKMPKEDSVFVRALTLFSDCFLLIMDVSFLTIIPVFKSNDLLSPSSQSGQATA